MQIGKHYNDKCKDQADSLQHTLSLVKPHRVFAWYPVKVETGQKVWLQFVWRIGYNFEGISPLFVYFLEEDNAREASIKNNWDCVYKKEIYKQLV